MEKDSLFVGLGMLLAPILILLILKIIESGINFEQVGIAVVGILYFGTAFYLLIKGVLSKGDVV